MRMPTIHQTPFIRFLAPMIVGILIYSYFPSFIVGITIGLCSIIVYLLSSVLQSTKKAYRFRFLFGIGLSLAFAFIGFVSTYFFEKKWAFDFPAGKNTYSAEITSVPEEKDRSIYCQLEVSLEKDSTKSTHKKQILAYFHKDAQSMKLHQGDRLWIYAEPQPLVNTNRPGSFDFATYLQRQGYCATTYIDSAYWKKRSIERAFNLTYYATDMRENILSIFRSFRFKENEFALLSGITIGYKDALTTDQKNNFSAVGLSHLMAVSGMQTAMVFSMFWFLLGFIPKNSKFYRLKYVVVILGLWIFTYVTGLSASVVRASIMLTVLMVGGLFNRHTITLNSLAFSAFCLLIYNPLTLFDIGFQLSYLAVVAIIFAQDLFQDKLENMRKAPKYFAELILMTMAAQIGTSPLSIFYFHQFPLLFLVVNLIVLPFNAFLVYLASLCTTVAALNIPYFWFGKVLQLLLFSLDKVTEIFAQIPYAQIHNLYPSALEITLCYLLLISILVFVYRKRFRIMLYSLGILLAIVVSVIYFRLDAGNRDQLLVYNQFGKNVVEYVSNGKSFVGNPKDRIFFLANKRIVRVNHDIRFLSYSTKLDCDYLILEKGFKGDKTQLDAIYNYKTVILDASLSRFYIKKLEESNVSDSRICYNMTQKGAFVLTIDKNNAAQ